MDGCLPQILLGPFLNTLFQIALFLFVALFFIMDKKYHALTLAHYFQIKFQYTFFSV